MRRFKSELYRLKQRYACAAVSRATIRSHSWLIIFKRTEDWIQPLIVICGVPEMPMLPLNRATPTTAPDWLSTGDPLEPLAKSAVMFNKFISSLRLARMYWPETMPDVSM